MSMYVEERGKKLVYSDGRAKQAFRDDADVNKMLHKAAEQNSLSHLMKYPEATYGEFENYDLLEAYRRIERAEEIFSELPSEVRTEFGGSPARFCAFAADPVNNPRLRELLPAIAQPGWHFPHPNMRGAEMPAPSARVVQKPSEAAGDEQAEVEGGSPPPSSSAT